ncbi:hypothetical protein Cgig2_018794 [Carnegiea gigantea]|uniref:Uncharacterized protein n=1 Tax=Carnegiea gigantea TaxID=171969 RepID=A0A9Q1QE17_9CARY|nr:hypothetical protein Cgig2_018794 [Carnegiea gigantea]
MVKIKASKPPNKKHPRCLADGNELLRFYGTTMACSLGLAGSSSLCVLEKCCLGGLNSLLAVEQNPSIPLVSKVLTIILGMDVSHGSPGHSDVPSIAACEHPLNCCLMLLLLLLGSLVVYHPYHDFLMYLAHYPKVLLPDPFESVQLKVEGLVGNIDREMLR